MAQFDLVNSSRQTDTLRRIRNVQLAVALWFGVFGLALLLVVLLLVDRRMRTDILAIEETLVQIEEQMVILGEPPPEAQQLNEEITRVNDLRVAVENIVLPPNIHWPAVISTIRAYDPQLIRPTSLVQTENRITLEGRAASNEVVVDYVRRMDQSPLFSRVDVQSIRNVSTTAHLPGPSARPHGLAKVTLPAYAQAPLAQAEREQEVQFVLLFILELASPVQSP